MGNCFFCGEENNNINNKRRRKNGGDVENSLILIPSNDKTLTENMMFETNRNVFHDYEITKEIGIGSMGAVSKVIRLEFGGSAYLNHNNNTSSTMKNDFSSSLGMLFFSNNSSGNGSAINNNNKPPSSSQPSSKKGNTTTDGAAAGGGENAEYALKTIQLGRVTQEFVEELQNEIDILRTLDHPNIVKLFEVYETHKQIFLVMELCSGGDLYARNPYTELEAASITGKLLSAVAYMHKHKVVHRDLKFENIMFENTKPNAEIKVIDFGLSKKFVANEKYMSEGVGTIYTMAPQVLQGVYTSKADLWSVGVIVYMLLSSTKPFYHRRRRYVIDKIIRCDYNFDGPTWDHVSKEAKNFVSSLLQLHPKKRLSAEQALKHKWLSSKTTTSSSSSATSTSASTPTSSAARRPNTQGILQKVHEGIVDFSSISEFKKLALRIVAYKSTSAQDIVVTLRKAFDIYDSSNDGIISFLEFRKALSHCDYTDEELNHLFDSMDTDDSGTISYTEFLAATIEAHGMIEENRLAEAFDRIDSDDTGFISKQNVADLLGQNSTPERIEHFFADADFDHDGKISFQEFLKAARKENNAYLNQVYNNDNTTPNNENNNDNNNGGGGENKGGDDEGKEKEVTTASAGGDDANGKKEEEEPLLDPATAIIPGGKFEEDDDENE